MPRTATPFVPLQADYYEDDALADAGLPAELLFVRGLAYCARALTDGFISHGKLARVVGVGMTNPEELAAKLCDVGPDEGPWTRVDGGYRVTRWLKYNRSAEEISTFRANDRARKTRSEVSNGTPPPLPPESKRKPSTVQRESRRIPDGIQADSVRIPPPYTDTDAHTDAETETTPPTPRRGARRPKVEPEGFAEFYQAFPNHKARPNAATAWAKLSPTDQAAAMAGVSRYAAYVEAEIDDPHKILHPATYLNQRRWEDEYRGPGRHLVPVGDGRPARIPTTTQRVAEIDALREKMLRGQG